jgi:hypothetical protein
MIPTTTLTQVEFRQIVDRFCELTGWASDHLGAWNADPAASIIVHVELAEQTRQHEQDWVMFYYPDNSEFVTKDKESLLSKNKGQYRGRDTYTVPLESVLQWLTLNGELPDVGEILVVQ